MKKLFTLFILAALFAIPRNAQAVYWEVSDGTHYRVNPKNPSDPNDTIPIPAGTKFMRPMIGYYYAARWIDGGWSYLLTPEVNTNGPDFNGWYNGPSITSTTGIRINQSLVTPLSGNTYDHRINFPDAALRARLVERILGYNWLQISYGNNSYSSVFQNPTTEKIKYAYQIVITEAEADSITELNFDPEEYGLNPVLGGVMSLKGLEMFRNLEKLVLRGNRYLGMSWGTNCYSCEILQYASEHIDFSVFPKLKILDISNIGRAYHGTLSSSELPSSLEYLYMINSSLYDALYLDGSTNLKKIEISGSVGWQTAHREAHAPSWHYDDVHSPCQDGFSNIAITNSTIDSLILRDNPHLYSLTFGDTQDRSKIKYLDVSGSKIKKLSSVGHGIEIDTIIARDVDFTPGGVLSSQEGVGYGQLEWTGKNLKYLDVSGSTIGTVSCPNMLGSFDIVVTGSIIKRLNLRDNNFTHLDVSDGNIEELYCQNNMLETLKVNESLLRLECQNNNLSALNIPSTPDTPVQEHVSYNTYWTIVPTPDFDPSNFNEEAAYLTGIDYNPDCGDPNNYQFDYFDYETGRWMRYREVNDYCDWEYNGLGGVTRTEIPAPEGYTAKYVTDTIKTYTGGPGTNAITYLDCSNNSPMTSLTLPKASNLETLYCYNNNLTSLDLTACTSLKILRMSHNKISQINISNCKRLEEIYARNRNGERGFSGWNHGLTSLDCSGLKNLHTVLVPRNKMTSLNMSGCEALRTLQCEAQGGDTVRLLDTLNLAGCTNLTTLECQNNGLTSLDISTCTKLQPSGVKAYMQRNVKDVVVLDRDKVCIELVNGVTPTI
ncbi:MAG: leucine-rich repeat domain-containing protein, partial [Paludibacteraceae bacterium]|nr:leucine-rich repeat domain-containing protein [Paludibacteraceae bacterium]